MKTYHFHDSRFYLKTNISVFSRFYLKTNISVFSLCAKSFLALFLIKTKPRNCMDIQAILHSGVPEKVLAREAKFKTKQFFDLIEKIVITYRN